VVIKKKSLSIGDGAHHSMLLEMPKKGIVGELNLRGYKQGLV